MEFEGEGEDHGGELRAWRDDIGSCAARIYSPTLGRFKQTDPIGYADGLNWYIYLGGDPVNFKAPRATLSGGPKRYAPVFMRTDEAEWQSDGHEMPCFFENHTLVNLRQSIPWAWRYVAWKRRVFAYALTEATALRTLISLQKAE